MRLLQRTLALLRQDAEGQIHDRAGRYSSGIQTRAERTISLKSPGCYVRLDHGISQLSIRLTERNRAFNFSGRIQNTNLTGAKARAVLRIIDCLIFLWEHRLNARRFKGFPAPPVRSDFN